jgi:uncharacterized membrane protein YphA (DoxX/SURF4 family)
MKFIKIFSRIFVGLVFIFSGFIKGIDVLGYTYKITDYFIAFKMSWFTPLAFYIAIFFCVFEFVLGVALIFRLKTRLTSILLLLFMSFFTILTFYLALKNPVSDCGCFGDFLIISNWQTFYKNIVLMIFTLIIFFTRNSYKKPKPAIYQFSIFLLGLIAILSVIIYCYRHLPIIDSLPWKKGNNIRQLVLPTPEISKIFLIYKNKTTGETKEYPSDNYPWQDTVWLANWQFVDQRKEIIKPFIQAPIHDFTINDEFGDDYTFDYINKPGYQFILVAYDLNKTNKKAFSKAELIYNGCQKDSISFIALTGTSYISIHPFVKELSIKYHVYNTDETALKTIIRSNPGLVLIKDGVVLEKWHYNDFPEYSKLKEKYIK